MSVRLRTSMGVVFPFTALRINAGANVIPWLNTVRWTAISDNHAAMARAGRVRHFPSPVRQFSHSLRGPRAQGTEIALPRLARNVLRESER